MFCIHVMLDIVIVKENNRGFEKSFHIFESGHEILYWLEGDHEIFNIIENFKQPFPTIFVNNSLT